jgi:hypothetical protein
MKRIPGCHGKRGYGSYQDAVAMREKRQKENGAGELRIYRCTFCRMWHLTSRTDGRDRKRAEQWVADAKGAPMSSPADTARLEGIREVRRG